MHPATMVHRNDPDTSAISAERVTARGTAKKNRELLAELVRIYPGRTYAELALAAKRWPGGKFAALADPIEIGRRKSEVRAAGQLHDGEKRLCSVKKTMCRTLWPSRSEASGQRVLF